VKDKSDIDSVVYMLDICILLLSSGSLGKGTAVKDKSGIDLVVYMLDMSMLLL
jgi:hypothetical protein